MNDVKCVKNTLCHFCRTGMKVEIKKQKFKENDTVPEMLQE